MAQPLVRRGRGDRREARPRPDRPRDREGGQGLDPGQHPPRMDVRRFRRAQRRRDRRPDLPDQLGRGMPVRARELRREARDRRERRAARQDRGDPRAAPEARAGRADGGRGGRRDHARGAARAWRRAHDPGMGGALRVDPPGGHLHLHLHLRHHRTAEGLRDQPRQLPRDARHDVERARRRGERDRLPLPAARPLLRAAPAARRLRGRRRRSPTGSAIRSRSSPT